MPDAALWGSPRLILMRSLSQRHRLHPPLSDHPGQWHHRQNGGWGWGLSGRRGGCDRKGWGWGRGLDGTGGRVNLHAGHATRPPALRVCSSQEAGWETG